MPQMLMIADDLTGAADCGVACAGHGLTTVVVLGDVEGEVNAEVLSVDADTRALGAEQAASETERLIRRHMRDEEPLLFKKLDSTLRGNVAAELAATLNARRALDSTGERIVAVLAPAFPASGRTTSNGRQLLHGKPLEDTELWQLESMPARSHIPEILNGAHLRSALLTLELIRGSNGALRQAMRALAQEADVLICDAETDSDLRIIADASMALGRKTIWAGSAGLAHHLPLAAGLVRAPLASSDRSLAAGPTLFVVGSVSSVSREQVDVLTSACDVNVIKIPPRILLAGAQSAEWRLNAQALKQELSAGRDVAVLPDAESRLEPCKGKLLAAALAEMVRPYRDMVGALVATGGESARAVFEAWGITRLRLIGELEPGLPFSVTEGYSMQLPVLTKAGGFGGPQTLLHCRQFLRELDRSTAANFPMSKGL